MKRILIIILLLKFWALNFNYAYAVELLVQAKPHWQDGYTQQKKDSLSPSKLRNHNVRSQIGDIIIVKPDGWEWGKEEGLPNFYIIKVPNLSFEDAKHLEDSLMEGIGVDKVTLKKRKFQLPPGILNQADVNGIITINENSQVIDALIKKTK
ncbi:MAG: hypothetical protein ACUZ8H_06735 [Candidatus Anammoxibacter sp.]